MLLHALNSHVLGARLTLIAPFLRSCFHFQISTNSAHCELSGKTSNIYLDIAIVPQMTFNADIPDFTHCFVHKMYFCKPSCSPWRKKYTNLWVGCPWYQIACSICLMLRALTGSNKTNLFESLKVLLIRDLFTPQFNLQLPNCKLWLLTLVAQWNRTFQQNTMLGIVVTSLDSNVLVFIVTCAFKCHSSFMIEK